MNSQPTVDERAYGKLLQRTLPGVIKSDEPNERYIRMLEALTDREDLSAEEQKLAELLTLLIEKYEEQHYALRRVSPLVALRELMEANGLKQRDLLDVFRSEGITSKVLRGKRELSKSTSAGSRSGFMSRPNCSFAERDCPQSAPCGRA